MLTAVSAEMLCSDPLKKEMSIPQAALTYTHQTTSAVSPLGSDSAEDSLPPSWKACIPSPVDFGVQRLRLLALSETYSCPVVQLGHLL